MAEHTESLIECVSPEELARDEHWWRIYDSAFPPEECEPPEVILKSLHAGVGLVFRLRTEKHTVGIASLHLLQNPAAVFLVYLAVGKNQRGQGNGRKLFDAAWQLGTEELAKRGLTSQGMIWEVDAPELAETELERMKREQRIALFQHLGGILLERPYLQPPVNGPAPVPMRLMYRAHSPEAALPATFFVDDLVRGIYFEKYAAVNGIPPEVLTGLLSEER